MIKCVEFNTEFKTIEHRNSALLMNMTKLIELKSEATYKAHEKGQFKGIDLKEVDSLKAAFDMQDGFFYPIINTTNWMDSHKDVHFPSLWDESLVEVKNSLSYVVDHKLEIDSTVAFPGSVEAFVKYVDWLSLGKNLPGQTQALIFKIAMADIFHKAAERIIKQRIAVQNSVRMGYDKMTLAINDTRPEFKENKDYFDMMVNSIVNKNIALEDGYFWGIEKARILKEGSMVLYGSNEVTPIFLPYENMIVEHKTEVAEPIKEAVKTIYNYLV